MNNFSIKYYYKLVLLFIFKINKNKNTLYV